MYRGLSALNTTPPPGAEEIYKKKENLLINPESTTNNKQYALNFWGARAGKCTVDPSSGF